MSSSAGVLAQYQRAQKTHARTGAALRYAAAGHCHLDFPQVDFDISTATACAGSWIWLDNKDKSDIVVADQQIHYTSFRICYCAYGAIFSNVGGVGTNKSGATGGFGFNTGSWYFVGNSISPKDRFFFLCEKGGENNVFSDDVAQDGEISVGDLSVMVAAGAFSQLFFSNTQSLSQSQVSAIASGRSVITDFIAPEIYVPADDGRLLPTSRGSTDVAVSNVGSGPTVVDGPFPGGVS